MVKIRLLLSVGLFVLLFFSSCGSDDDPVDPLDNKEIITDPVDVDIPLHNQFQLSVTISPVNSGSMNIYIGNFDEGTPIELKGTPNAIYRFKEWQGDLTGSDNPSSVIMDKNKTITAVFELNNLAKTYVPDDNFERALIELGYDQIMDNYVLTSNISGISSLGLNSLAIRDLTGIEGFASLSQLGLYNNEIASLDLSGNTELTILDCRSNNLTNLDLSKNRKLSILSVSFNRLTFLDLTQNTLLKYIQASFNNLTAIDLIQNISVVELDLYHNQLTSLDLTRNTLLASLSVFGNQLNEIDLSQNTLLERLSISENQLTEIDLSQNASLKKLEISSNQLTQLDLSKNLNINSLSCNDNKISTLDLLQNRSLMVLNCSFNRLTSLDMSNIPHLYYLYCSDNELTSLNLNNGNNSALRGYGFIDPPPPPNAIYIGLNATNNPLLNCIQVDDVEKINSGVAPYKDWKKDDIAVYSTNCD